MHGVDARAPNRSGMDVVISLRLTVRGAPSDQPSLRRTARGAGPSRQLDLKMGRTGKTHHEKANVHEG